MDSDAAKGFVTLLCYAFKSAVTSDYSTYATSTYRNILIQKLVNADPLHDPRQIDAGEYFLCNRTKSDLNLIRTAHTPRLEPLCFYLVAMQPAAEVG